MYVSSIIVLINHAFDLIDFIGTLSPHILKGKGKGNMMVVQQYIWYLW